MTASQTDLQSLRISAGDLKARLEFCQRGWNPVSRFTVLDARPEGLGDLPLAWAIWRLGLAVRPKNLSRRTAMAGAATRPP